MQDAPAVRIPPDRRRGTNRTRGRRGDRRAPTLPSPARGRVEPRGTAECCHATGARGRPSPGRGVVVGSARSKRRPYDTRRARRTRPRDHRGAAGGRPGDLCGHRPAGRALGVLGARTRPQARAGRRDPRLPGCRRPRRAGTVRDGPDRGHAARPDAAGRPSRPCPRTSPRSRTASASRARPTTSSRSARATTEDLEDLIRRLREKGEVQTRTTVVLSIAVRGPTGPALDPGDRSSGGPRRR